MAVRRGLRFVRKTFNVIWTARKTGAERFYDEAQRERYGGDPVRRFEGRTTGTPISMLVRNQDQHSKDYSEIASYYRPGHADYTFDEKYGFRDYRGGGRLRDARRSDAWQQALSRQSCWNP